MFWLGGKAHLDRYATGLQGFFIFDELHRATVNHPIVLMWSPYI